MEKAKTDELIYKNANQYRLHADNLRWTLLGGYAAFIVAILSLSKSNIDIINNAIFYLLLFAVSWGYFWILAVQNWFYNLFARFVDDCENRLTLGKNLQTLKSFAQKKGNTINPFHPAFYIVELLIGTLSYYFLYSFIDRIYLPKITEWVQNFGTISKVVIIIIGYAIFMILHHVVLKNWDKCIYKGIIKKTSNLYKQVEITDENIEEEKS